MFTRLIHRILAPIIRCVILAFIRDDPTYIEEIDINALVHKIEHYIYTLPRPYPFGIILCFLTLQFAIPPLAFKIRPMTWLSKSDRDRYFEKWANSRFLIKRLVFIGVKFTTVTHIYREPFMIARIGYEPTLKERKATTCTLMAQK